MEENGIREKIESKRTEHVQDIIDRMPTKFGKYTAAIVVFIFLLLMVFGWLIRYPDIVVGKIEVNNSLSSTKLVSNVSGKLHLIDNKFQKEVEKDEPLAYIESTANYDSVIKIKRLLSNFLEEKNYTETLKRLPKKITIGEITSSYYQFLASLEQLRADGTVNPYQAQANNLGKTYQQQKIELRNQEQKLELMRNNLKFAQKMYRRDSLLHSQGVISEMELDQSNLRLLEAKNNLKSFQSNINSMNIQLQSTQSNINEVGTKHDMNKINMDFSVINSYNELMEAINNWELKYLIKSPVKGRLQKLGFWQENQFIKAGEEIFSVSPRENRFYGQMYLPTNGAGKVEKGQEVMVKLEDYPYLEYGVISGEVENISTARKEMQTAQGAIETYLVVVSFPEGLKTNYGEIIETYKSSSGMAEIITKDRRLIHRFFDNLKYILSK